MMLQVAVALVIEKAVVVVVDVVYFARRTIFHIIAECGSDGNVIEEEVSFIGAGFR